MVITSYGTFWQRDEVDWRPGKGKRNAFRLLGRRGATKKKLRLADFRRQRGIYILYGDYGPHYVGLARNGSIGSRLKAHLTDSHANRWDRFSWFGFRPVLKKKDKNGIRVLKDLAEISVESPGEMIREMEALLIQAMGLTNKLQMKFIDARRWKQIKQSETAHFLKRARS